MRLAHGQTIGNRETLDFGVTKSPGAACPAGLVPFSSRSEMGVAELPLLVTPPRAAVELFSGSNKPLTNEETPATGTVNWKTGPSPLPSLSLSHRGHSTNEVVHVVGGGEREGEAGGKDKVQERVAEERRQEGCAHVVASKYP